MDPNDPFRFVEWCHFQTDGRFYTHHKEADEDSEVTGQVEVGYCEFGSRDDGEKLTTISFARDGEVLFWEQDEKGDVSRERFMNPDTIDYRDGGVYVEDEDDFYSWDQGDDFHDFVGSSGVQERPGFTTF